MNKVLFIFITVLLLTGCFGSEDSDTGGAINETGSIKGVVRDSGSGEVLLGVSVVSGDFTAMTNLSGMYMINSISVGEQAVTASKEGFRTYSGVANIIKGNTVTLNIVISKLLPLQESSLTWDRGNWNDDTWQ